MPSVCPGPAVFVIAVGDAMLRVVSRLRRVFVSHTSELRRQLDEDTLIRRRRVLGEDHPHALGSASNLVVNLRELGEHERARELEDWIRARCER